MRVVSFGRVVDRSASEGKIVLKPVAATTAGANVKLRDVSVACVFLIGPPGQISPRSDDDFNAAADGARHSEVFHLMVPRASGDGWDL